MSDKNDYMNEVLEQQVRVDNELKRNRAPMKAQMMRNIAPVDQLQNQMVAPAMAQAAYPSPAPGSPAAHVRTPSPSQAQSPDTGMIANPSTSGDSGRAVEYRITGFWRFKTVVVPPNVYVVHTRKGYLAPIHIGLGISFNYNPFTDAFLLIPAAMQTISINAKCICKERQGVLVQAYVQWVIDDIKTAYRKLDFSDPEDPMRIVNVQLREQAEAAIKDKVATMSIDGVLSDKQPIIEELTHRLRVVAEGSREGNGTSGPSGTSGPANANAGANSGSGLGLKIVTVQIKEAVVSSTRVWENLQAPFRAEREKLARLAQLEAEQVIAARELESAHAKEQAEMESENTVAARRAQIEREQFDREQTEQLRRQKLEQENEQESIRQQNATAKARKDAELELALKQFEIAAARLEKEIESVTEQARLDAAVAERESAKVRSEIEIADWKSNGASENAQRELALQKVRRAIENDVSSASVQTQLIARLPEIAKALPKIDSHRSVSIGGGTDGSATSVAPIASLVASVMALLDGWRNPAATPAATAPASAKPS